VAVPGDSLGSYDIVRAIGAGGMGEVYLARDTRLGRMAAIKLLPADLAANRDRLERFVQEARLASSLNHPNIATVYEVGDANRVPFIAMEYVEGETLSHRLRRGPLPVAEAIALGVQVSEALQVAHARGVTHRDIKPDNLMLRTDGYVKVLDFGLAKLTEPRETANDASTILAGLTQAGVVVGTIDYMSPEQARGQAVDHRSDVFSLGVVLFETLTARRPFAGATAVDRIAAILNHDAGVPSALVAGVPAELDRIVRKAMRKDAGERYGSIGEMLADLKALRRDLDATTTRTTATPARRSSSMRHATTAAIVVALAMAAAFGYARLAPARPGPAIDSVAVLPFTHSGADANMAFLADGLSETVTSNLSQLSGLRVMSRTAAERYRAKTGDPQGVGRELNVRAVLVGTVAPRGDMVTINLELVDVTDGRQLWGRQYPRPLADLVQLQSEISRDVAETLRPRLTGTEQQHLRQLPTANADAYQLYLRGRFFARKLTGDGLQSAIENYTQAVVKDPTFVQAHVGLAEAYILQGTDFLAPREVMPRAMAHAVTALELQPDFPDAHAALGIVKLAYEWDWKGAAQELSYGRTIESPAIESFSCALHYADPLGRNQDAIAALQSAVASEPQSLSSNLELGCASYYGRRYDQAVRQFRGTLELYPKHEGALFSLGRALVQQGRPDEAITEMTAALRGLDSWPQIVSELGYAHARLGHTAAARQMLAQLAAEAKLRFVDPYLVAAVHAGLGEKDAAFAGLNRAADDRSGWLPWLKVEPKWEPLHNDPRFADLLRRVGLPVS